MNRFVSVIIMTLLLASMLTLASHIKPVKAGTITVPDDYPTIQAAINAASDGDTVFVRNGTYYENVVVNKTLSFIGEDRDNTILDGSGFGTVVDVTVSNATVKGFTIQNSGNVSMMDSGVKLARSHSNVIDNIILDNMWGVCQLSSANDTTIEYNVVMNNGQGILLFYGITNVNFVVQRNTIRDNQDSGIWVWGSGNIIRENLIAGNTNGIYLHFQSSENAISENNITNNERGICLSTDNNMFFHNNLTNNAQQVANYVPSTNLWDDGYPSGGNYWSDYGGTDFFSGAYQNETGSDGIGDSPYIVDENNQDGYPLMKPFVPFENQPIYIRADGSVDPSGAPLLRNGDLYILESSIRSAADGIVIERDNIMLNGDGYGFQGRAPYFSDSKGIDLSGRENVSIMNINVDKFGWGISCYGSSNVSVFRSSLTANNYYAVLIQSSIACRMSENNVTNNYYGIFLFNSTYSTLSESNIANNGIGVIFEQSHSNTVTENIVENAGIGVMLVGSCYNCFEGNVMASCGDALSICASSSNNSIIRNSIASTTGYGIGVFRSTDNTVVSNNISDNEVGIMLTECSNNTLFHNNVVNNARQVYDYSWDYPEYPLSINTWDDGYPSGGNYWSDYNGTDTNGDGVGDVPYVIDADNQDNYPLVSPYEYWSNPIPADVNRDMRVDIRDIAYVCLRFLTTPASPNWNSICDMNSDGVVNMSDIAITCGNFGKHYS